MRGYTESSEEIAGQRAFRGSSSADRAAVSSSQATGMEVEVKLRLNDKEAHDKLVDLLKADVQKTWQQENFYFDGSAGELSSQRVMLRCRFYNNDEKAIVTLKGKMAVVDGIGRATEEEDPVDPALARTFMDQPSQLLSADLPVLKKLRSAIEVSELKCLGGFTNVRKEIPWGGQMLEVDETQYAWGTVYEIECETTEPESLRDSLEAFLKDNGIAYKHNTSTKFSNFVNKTLI